MQYALVAVGSLHPQQFEVLVEEISVRYGKFKLFYSKVVRQLDRVFQSLLLPHMKLPAFSHCLGEMLA